MVDCSIETSALVQEDALAWLFNCQQPQLVGLFFIGQQEALTDCQDSMLQRYVDQAGCKYQCGGGRSDGFTCQDTSLHSRQSRTAVPQSNMPQLPSSMRAGIHMSFTTQCDGHDAAGNADHAVTSICLLTPLWFQQWHSCLRPRRLACMRASMASAVAHTAARLCSSCCASTAGNCSRPYAAETAS